MKIYIVRHGETESNVKRLFQGRINTGINENGIEQAKRAQKYFEDKNIDLIISSPMTRCKETAEIISNNKIAIIFDDRLIGRNHGEFTGNDRTGTQFLDYWNYYKNVKYKEAENIQDLYHRSVDTLLALKTQYKNKNIVLVTHSGVCKSLYFYLNGIPTDGDFTRHKPQNCGILECDI